MRSHSSLLQQIIMEDRATKLRKLNDFRRRLPHCSASALAAIIADVKEHAIPEGRTDRKAFREGTRADLCKSICHAVDIISRVQQLFSFLSAATQGQAPLNRGALALGALFR